MHQKPFPSALDFLGHYEIYKKVPGSSQTILTHPPTSSFVLMKQSLHQSSALKETVESLQNLRSNSNNHVLSLIEYYIKGAVVNGQVKHKITSFFQYQGQTLLDEVNKRQNTGRGFQENELWDILCSAVMGLAHMERNQVGHACVSLLDIFITVDGAVKVIDPTIASAEPSQFQEGYYYSPQMLQFFGNPNVHPDDIDIYRSDIFTLALCIIHISLVQPCDSCLDQQNWCIDFDELQSKLRVVSQHYSEQFVNVLVHMLSQNPNDRPEFQELEKYLIATINERDQIFGQKCPISLSQQFYKARAVQQESPYENQTIESTGPDDENQNNSDQGIPSSIIDSFNIDTNTKLDVKQSFKQITPSSITLAESVSVNNTDRFATEKRTSGLDSFVQMRVHKEEEKIDTGKNELSGFDLDFLKVQESKQLVNQDKPLQLGYGDQNSRQKTEISNKEQTIESIKIVTKKWNVIKQPTKNQSKVFRGQLQTRSNKPGTLASKGKKPLQLNSKIIKRGRVNKQNSLLNQNK